MGLDKIGEESLLCGLGKPPSTWTTLSRRWAWWLATFPRKALAARLTKRYQTMDKEIKHRELGTSNAKLALIDALRILKRSQAEDVYIDTRKAGKELIQWENGIFGRISYLLPTGGYRPEPAGQALRGSPKIILGKAADVRRGKGGQ